MKIQYIGFLRTSSMMKMVTISPYKNLPSNWNARIKCGYKIYLVSIERIPSSYISFQAELRPNVKTNLLLCIFMFQHFRFVSIFVCWAIFIFVVLTKFVCFSLTGMRPTYHVAIGQSASDIRLTSQNRKYFCLSLEKCVVLL